MTDENKDPLQTDLDSVDQHPTDVTDKEKVSTHGAAKMIIQLMSQP